MRIVSCAIILFCLAFPSTLFAIGFAHDKTFIVYAPDQALADQVLAKAAEFRKAEAKNLLGVELEAGKGPTIITVALSDRENSGYTWPIDHPDRKFHEMWLTTTRECAAGSILRHEIRHVVLNTRFPDRLPPWIEEGLASRWDNVERQRKRQETVAAFAQCGWPDIHSITDLQKIHATDKTTYAAATSLVSFLLTLGDLPKLFEFAVAGKKSGWDQALHKCYNISKSQRVGNSMARVGCATKTRWPCRNIVLRCSSKEHNGKSCRRRILRECIAAARQPARVPSFSLVCRCSNVKRQLRVQYIGTVVIRRALDDHRLKIIRGRPTSASSLIPRKPSERPGGRHSCIKRLHGPML